MPGRLQVGWTTIPYVDEQSNLKVNDSIRYVAEQAFAPFSTMAVGTNATQAYTTTTFTVITGATIDLVVPVPSRVRIHGTVRASCTTHDITEGLQVAIFRDAAQITAATQYWAPGAVDEAVSISISYLEEDLFPETTYTYDVRCKVITAATAEYEVMGTRSNLLLTTEGNQRV